MSRIIIMSLKFKCILLSLWIISLKNGVASEEQVAPTQEQCEVNCIRKCCGLNEKLSEASTKCVPTSEKWEPKVFDSVNDLEPIAAKDIDPASIRWIHSFPEEQTWCPDAFGPVLLDSNEFPIRILQDSNVAIQHDTNHPSWTVLDRGTFCIDNFEKNGTDLLAILDCSPPQEGGSHQTLYIVFQAIACVSLIVTVLVHLILWEKQNIHSWTLLGYAISMLLLHLSIFVTYIHNAHVSMSKEGEDLPCTILAIVSHFLYLTTFCWLTLINFDVWWTFSKLKVRMGGSNWRRFVLYFLFAMFVPTAVISTGLILNIFVRTRGDLGVLEYSQYMCYIDSSSELFFRYLPVAILLGCNIILFIITVATLYKIRESTKIATSTVKSGSGHREAEASKFLLFVKLFFVMGLLWILELVSYFSFGRGSDNIVAYVLDVINILQPLAIFVIFVCKGDTLRAIQLKLPMFQRIFQYCGLKGLRDRFGSGLSSASVVTQVSTLSMRSSNSSNDGSWCLRDNVSFEMG